MAILQTNKQDTEATSAWLALSHILPPRGLHEDYWWSLTGRDLARMLNEAGYQLAEQYDALLFHYHWAVPYLGPGPKPKGQTARTLLTGPDDLPIEYSWQWNASNGQDIHPVVRWRIELAGCTPEIPGGLLHQRTLGETMHRLVEQVPGVDLQGAEHFLATLLGHDDGSKDARLIEGDACFATTSRLAVAFDKDGLSFQAYFLPHRATKGNGRRALALWKNSLSRLQPRSAARDLLYDFLETSAEGERLIPVMLALETAAPTQSHLKLFLQTASTNFASVFEVMSAGGRIPLSTAQRRELRSLICAVTGAVLVDDDNDDDADALRTLCDMRHNEGDHVQTQELLAPARYTYSFDVASGGVAGHCSGIELYLPLRHAGPNDLDVARDLVAWLEARGRGDYGPGYLRMLQWLATHRRSDPGRGIQTCLGVAFDQKGHLSIVSYMSTGASDLARGNVVVKRRRGRVGFTDF